jgi:hypothetical protein
MKVRMTTPLDHTSTMASIGASKPALHIARNPLPIATRSSSRIFTAWCLSLLDQLRVVERMPLKWSPRKWSPRALPWL